MTTPSPMVRRKGRAMITARSVRFALATILLAACGSTVGSAPDATSGAAAGVSKTVERGPSDFTGNYMTDNRPNWIGWLALTQTGTSVSGSLITVDPDGKGSTIADTLTVTGSTDGANAVSLTTGSVFGTTGTSISGRRSGDQITLSYPNKTGQLQAAVYRAASQAAFNQLLADWQAQLGAAKADADRAAAAQKAINDRNAALAQAVRDRSADLKSLISLLASGTSTRKEQIASAVYDINGEQADLTHLQSDFNVLQSDAKEPIDQYKACVTVSYDFNVTMGYDFNTALGYDRGQFATVATTLQTNLGAVDQRTADIQAAAAALAAAITASPLTVTGVLAPGDEKATLDTYRATAASVTTQLATLRATDASTYASAANLLAQGQIIWNTVKAKHGCS
jgi:hypothetical protein